MILKLKIVRFNKKPRKGEKKEKEGHGFILILSLFSEDVRAAIFRDHAQ